MIQSVYQKRETFNEELKMCRGCVSRTSCNLSGYPPRQVQLSSGNCVQSDFDSFPHTFVGKQAMESRSRSLAGGDGQLQLGAGGMMLWAPVPSWQGIVRRRFTFHVGAN